MNAREPAVHAENPATLLERVFEDIAASRMAGLPILNEALTVEAVGFRRWRELWLGVLVTPWSVNLTLLPGGNPAFRALDVGHSQIWSFPSGEYEFMGAAEPGLGHYQICSLFSPAFEFATQADAVATAEAALEALLRNADEDVAQPVSIREAAQQCAREQALLTDRSAASRPVSRRAFLRGGFLTGWP